MSSTIATWHDRILDHATHAAIERAEADFPRFFEQAMIVEAAKTPAHELIVACKIEDEPAVLTLYTGIFVAAYQPRRAALTAAPTASSQNHSL